MEQQQGRKAVEFQFIYDSKEQGKERELLFQGHFANRFDRWNFVRQESTDTHY